MTTKTRIGGFVLPMAATFLFCFVVVTVTGKSASCSRRTRTLNFAERVACQRLIEEVYWRHRIWPKDNHHSKPPLDAVMSRADIEKKVDDYLRASQTLEDYWHTPIGPDQLQREIDRIASHTKQPMVLSEIFFALGNDPFVIAECLARPVLTERLMTQQHGDGKGFYGEARPNIEAQSPSDPTVRRMKKTSGRYPEIAWLKNVSAEIGTLTKKVSPAVNPISLPHENQGDYRAVGITKKDKPLPETISALSSAQYRLPAIASHLPDTCSVPWLPTGTTGAPSGKQYHTAVWTGSEMIVWGGHTEFSGAVNTGGRYNPATDSWTVTSITNAPRGRHSHTAVWTGSEMIVWGGNDGFGGTLDTGGRYNPSTDTWTAITTLNAPDPRVSYTAIWTGSQMIVWGGYNGNNEVNTGGKYTPSTDTWTATSITNAPARRGGHEAVWTGSQMIVWGGSNSVSYFKSGGRYNPSTDSWTATSIANAPVGRILFPAVWTGSEMIVWGGYNGPSVNSGGRYNPSTDHWAATSTTGAPDARENHTATWTGSQMIVFGGFNGSVGTFNTGGKYNPATDSWTATSTLNAPEARASHTAIWTGSELIIWGGLSSRNTRLNSGARYCPRAPNPQVLYDQYDNVGTDAVLSSKFTDSPSYNSDLADDFVVPAGQIWYVQTIDADGRYFNGAAPADDWNVFLYTDNAGFPGAQVYGALHQQVVQSGTTFSVNLPTPAILTSHRYWLEIQANMTFATAGEWGWSDRTVTSNNAAAWRNPAGGFGLCPSWSRRGATCNLDPSAPDQVFRLKGTIGGASPTPTPNGTPSRLDNISTRASVQTGNNVMIGGFIVQGTGPKRVIIRAIGPELSQFGVPNPLANPMLELHNATGAIIGSNDDWQHTVIGGVITQDQVSDIRNSNHAPANPFESAIIADLPPGNYTAIVRGANNITGIALVEVYDLNNAASSLLGNISTRSFVQTDNNVMIGGFIVQGTGPKRVIIRAIGPELSQFGVADPLANPTLELHNAAGAIIGRNDDWQHTIVGGVITQDQVTDIRNSNHAPANPFESAIIADLPPGNYTAIVRGVNNTTGVALVEVYDLDR